MNTPATPSHRLLLARALAVALLLAAIPARITADQAAPQVQTVQLDSGWNLVAFQVLPTDPAPEAVFGPLGTDFVAAWTCDNSTRQWTRYARPGTPEAAHNPVAAIGTIQVGRAYWIYMYVPRSWQITGLPPTQAPPVDLRQGWNLIGIPTGTGQLTESPSVLSVLAASGLDYDAILRWEANLYSKFTPADADVDDFTVFDPNKGYWVHVNTTNFTLQPRLLSSIRADADVEPQENFPSFEDVELSVSVPAHAHRTPMGPTNQTHIVFLAGEDSQQLAIANTGGGILLWEIEWTPYDATNTAWLQFSASKGVTTIENDVVSLSLDRTSLAQGVYRGRLLLQTTAGNRVMDVIANVPGLGGEWRGSAQIATANGKANPLPKIDLHLDFYEDPTVPGLVRGLIDSRNSLLWPVDVPLIGHILTADGNTFSLGGAYILPPGDQNNPPYDQFSEDPNDVDWNCNRNIDAVNPFPFPIYRAVTLNGSLAQASPASGYVIEGRYTEMVYGMLRKPIRLEGSFTITRQSPKPFTDRRPVANVESAEGTQPVVVRTFTSPAGVTIRNGRTTNTLAFVTDMVLQDLSVAVDLADAPPASVKLTLVSPGGQQVVLHDRANITSLRNSSFPTLRQPVDPLGNLCTAGVATKGNWRLILENFSSTNGKLYSWSLQLQGQPVFDVAGQIVDSTSGAALPAQILLDGLPISQVALATADGSFLFARLPGIPLNFSANLPGYEATDSATPGLSGLFTTPSFGADCDSALRQALAAKFRALPAMPVPTTATEGFGTYGAITNPVVLTLQPRAEFATNIQILAAPSMGPGPLTVTLTLLGPSNAIPAGTAIRWSFGDGTSTNATDLRSVEHVYRTSTTNGYTVTATVGGANSFTQLITVTPSPGNTPNALNFFQVHFTSGGSIPADLALHITGTNDPGQPPPFANLLMVQHADCASFDIDRAPYTTPANRRFDADGFTNGMPSLNPADFANGFKAEDFNYQVGVDQWENAAECGYVVDDDFFNPHPKPGQTGDCAQARYRIQCNVGPMIIPMPDPELIEGEDGIAKARDLRLVTGPLSAFWNN